MPWSDEHKIQSREKILDSAADLFTAKGFDGVSIDTIMTSSGLTRGAFYAHFSSKSDIYNQSVLHSIQRTKCFIEQKNPRLALDLAREYLRIGTPESDLNYCPLAFLVSDINQRDENVKSTYTRAVKQFQELFVWMGLDKVQAVQVTTILIGGLALSRAITDECLKEGILDGCLAQVEQLLSR